MYEFDGDNIKRRIFVDLKLLLFVSLVDERTKSKPNFFNGQLKVVRQRLNVETLLPPKSRVKMLLLHALKRCRFANPEAARAATNKNLNLRVDSSIAKFQMAPGCPIRSSPPTISCRAF